MEIPAQLIENATIADTKPANPSTSRNKYAIIPTWVYLILFIEKQCEPLIRLEETNYVGVGVIKNIKTAIWKATIKSGLPSSPGNAKPAEEVRTAQLCDKNNS
jgi:hypothetical protein